MSVSAHNSTVSAHAEARKTPEGDSLAAGKRGHRCGDVCPVLVNSPTHRECGAAPLYRREGPVLDF